MDIPGQRRRLDPRSCLVLAALGAAALGLRLIGLGRDPLWYDESYRVLLATRPSLSHAPGLFYLGSSHPPLYLAMLRAWIEAFGSSELSVRLPSALAGAALVPAVFAFARRHFDLATAWLAALLASASPILLYYAQDASMYALLALAWLGLLHAQLLIQERPTRLRLLAFALAAAASLLLFDLSLVLIPASACVMLAVRRPRAALPLALGWSFALALYLPHLGVALREVTSEARAYLGRRWQIESPAAILARSVAGLVPGGGGTSKGARLPEDAHLRAGALCLCLLAIAAALIAPRRAAAVAGSEARAPIARAWALLAFVAAPLACLAAASIVKPIWEVGRHEIALTPVLLVLVARGIVVCPRPVRVAALVLFAALDAYTLRGFYASPRLDFVRDSRAVARCLKETSSEQDLIAFLGYAREPIEYQLRRLGVRCTLRSFPLENERHRGWITFRPFADAAYLASEIESLCETVARLPPGACVWLVGHRAGDQLEKVARALERCGGLEPLPSPRPPSLRVAGFRRRSLEG